MTDSDQRQALQDTIYSSRNPTRKWLHQSRREWIIESLSKYLVTLDSFVAEVGPGSGIYLPELARRSNNVIAIDVDQTHLERASKIALEYPHIRVVCNDITQSTLSSNSLSLILCTEVLEHLPNSYLALSEMHRLLKPGGILILTTPQRWSTVEMVAKIALAPPFISITRRLYREPVEPLGHINLMTAAELKKQLHDAGFEILEERLSGLYLPGIAECTGNLAVRLQKRLAKIFRNSPLKGLLWTQAYVLRA